MCIPKIIVKLSIHKHTQIVTNFFLTSASAERKTPVSRYAITAMMMMLIMQNHC